MARWLTQVGRYLAQPATILRGYRRKDLAPDLIAALTVAVVLLPQSIAYAQIAELPADFGLHTAIVAPIIGGLWGSSRHLHSGPTNAVSLIVLSTLVVLAPVGSHNYLVAAGMLALMAGFLQLILGLGRLGALVNFVSRSVVVGFTAGAAVLIAVNQLRSLFGIQFEGHGLHVIGTLQRLVGNLSSINWTATALGLGSVAVLLSARRISPKLPAALLAIALPALAVGLWELGHAANVAVVGALPRSLPPPSPMPIFDLHLIGELSAGALAVAAIGLTEAVSSSRSIAGRSGQRLDANQELVGQGLSKIATSLFSGYAGSGSFTRSTVSYTSGGRTQLASVFSGLFVLVAMLALGPLGRAVPKAALAGVLIVTAYDMIDRREIGRILQGSPVDRLVLGATFVGTLLLPLQFAVLAGVLVSFALYIKQSAEARVVEVLPDPTFRRLERRPAGRPPCPQLAILDVKGDLYFGSAPLVEDAVCDHLIVHPEQRVVVLRMHSVNQCDGAGIHTLDALRTRLRQAGGDLYLSGVHPDVLGVMRDTGFVDRLGADHLYIDQPALRTLFLHVLDPAICIYECQVRAFRECQNLPKRTVPQRYRARTRVPPGGIRRIAPRDLQERLETATKPRVIDVREPREFTQGHILGARHIPLLTLLMEPPDLPLDRPIVFVCQSGVRSTMASAATRRRGLDAVLILEGGMRGWKAAGLPLADAGPARHRPAE